MERISTIISEIYKKFLPIAEKGEIQLDLDLNSPDELIENTDQLIQDIESELNSALARNPKGHITIALRRHKILITDSGTTLSRTMCALLSAGRIFVKSRPGFGTTVEIDISRHEAIDSKTSDKSPK